MSLYYRLGVGNNDWLGQKRHTIASGLFTLMAYLEKLNDERYAQAPIGGRYIVTTPDDQDWALHFM